MMKLWWRRAVCVLLATGLSLAAGVTLAPFMAVAEEQPALDLNSADALRHVLEMQAGKRVKVKLVSGQELDGKVGKTGTHMVVLTELTGMELFDATVRVDQVAAVIVRARSR